MSDRRRLRIFEEATAIVTGGASGIGRAMAQELAHRGCWVMIADLQIEEAQALVDRIRTTGGKADAVQVDVTDGEALQRLVRETHERTGRLDYLFNNAGIGIVGGAGLYTLDDWNRIIDVNLRGVTNGIHAALPIMFAQQFGHIVNTASLSGLIPFPAGIAYAATKHAVVGLSKSLRAAAALMNVRVTVLCPGFIRTPILHNGGKFGKSYFQLPAAAAERMLARLNPMPPEIFARKAVDGVSRNKAMVIGRLDWQLFWRLHSLLPAWGIRLAQSMFEKNLIELGLLQKN